MKNIILVMLLGLVSVVGCNQRQDVNSMLENPNTRNEIFDSIINNPEHMNSFREYLQDHKGGSQMMMGNSRKGRNGMNGMKGGMGMNMQDSTAMMQSFMNNPQMMTLMLQRMNAKGMMSDDCMKNAMQMMNNGNMMDKN